MSVPVERATTWRASTPAELIKAPYYGGTALSYDVSRDGKRFLMASKAAPIKPQRRLASSLCKNWQEELKQHVPTR